MGWQEIAGAASQVGSAMINWGASKYNTDKTNQANKEMAEYSYSKDLEMWNRQNAYNSPEAQMLRLKNAGLNPNLVYGSSANTGNASQMPRYNAPTLRYDYQPPQLGSVIQQYQDMKLRQANIDNVTEMVKARKLQNEANDVTLRGKAINDMEYSLWRSMNMRGQARSNPWTYEDVASSVRPLMGDLARAKVDLIQSQILKYNQDAKRTMADTLLRGAELQLKNKDINWYTAQQISRMFSGVATGLGLAGIGRSLFVPQKPATIEMPTMPKFNNYIRNGFFNK